MKEPLSSNNEEGTTTMEEELLMEQFDRWNDRDRRNRFLRRMEHKLHVKAQRGRAQAYYD